VILNLRGILWDAVQDKRQKGKPVKEKKKALNKEDK